MLACGDLSGWALDQKHYDTRLFGVKGDFLYNNYRQLRRQFGERNSWCENKLTIIPRVILKMAIFLVLHSIKT